MRGGHFTARKMVRVLTMETVCASVLSSQRPTSGQKGELAGGLVKQTVALCLCSFLCETHSVAKNKL